MKIIIVGPAYPLRGGIANLNEALYYELKKAGHQVEIVSFKLQYPALLFPGKTQYDNSSVIPDIKIQTLINSINPYTWYKTARYITAQKPDLVIMRYWLPFMGPCLGSIAKKIKKYTRIIALCDNIIPHEKRPGDHFFTKYFIKHCHAFIAMSKSVLDDLNYFDKSKPRKLLYHPVYNIFGNKVSKTEAVKKLNLDENFKYILFFGIIRKYKGLDLLLSAYQKSELYLHHVKLIIAGEFYDKTEDYLDLINKLPKESIILHNHFIKSEDVKYYFCAADLIAQTYRSATQSGVTQIAYHFERPVLVTDTGGLSEMVDNHVNGYVTKISETEIANALIDYFKNNREENFTRAAAQKAKQFSWHTFITGIEQLYEMIKK